MIELQIDFNSEPTTTTLEHLAANGWSLYQWRGIINATLQWQDSLDDIALDREAADEWVTEQVGPDSEREDYSWTNPIPARDEDWAGGDGCDD